MICERIEWNSERKCGLVHMVVGKNPIWTNEYLIKGLFKVQRNIIKRKMDKNS